MLVLNTSQYKKIKINCHKQNSWGKNESITNMKARIIPERTYNST